MTMSMTIKNEFDQLVELVKRANGQSTFIAQDGKQYVLTEDGAQPIQSEPIEKPLMLTQLSSLVEWLTSDSAPDNGNLLLNVVSPTRVRVYGTELNRQGQRPLFAEVNAITPRINFGDFVNQERMVITLQSCFEPSEDREIILKVVSNLRDEHVQQQTDNGVSQSVQINSGVANAENVIVPNPVTLTPYRTFQEIEQPSSKFIYRMREGGNSALFTADNSMWQVIAKQRIKKYLEAGLRDKGVEGAVILA